MLDSETQIDNKVDELIKAMQDLTSSITDLRDNLPRPAPVSAGRERQSLTTSGALHVVIMGVRGHGKKHIDNFLKIRGCNIAYLCDVDTRVGNLEADEIEKTTGRRPKVVQDIREALQDKRVDIVSIAAPHHWHALAAIWALQAGKHVYIEKPLTHTYAEGASVLAAAKKYGKVVQFGTQLRSNASLAAAGDYMQAGKLGKVDLVHCTVYKTRPAMPLAQVAVPDTVDYDLYCGPAELRPPARGRFHYHWHWMWDLGNGALGNNGIHRVDAARIGLNLKGLGESVFSFGGRFGDQDAGETPNTQVAIHKFADTWVVQEVLGLKQPPFKKCSNGIIFNGSKGTIVYQGGRASLVDGEGEIISTFEGKQENHYKNFVDAVKKNDPAAVNGPVEEGQTSSALCHVANVSYRVGYKATDAEIMASLEKMEAPQKVKVFLERMRTNLTNNGVTENLQMGDLLYLDDSRGLFSEHKEARTLLTRNYREPYVVPAPENV